MNYYYANESSQPIGPCTAEHIRLLYQEGTLHANSWVIAEGASEWKPYAALFQAQPPTVLPSAPAAPAKASQRASAGPARKAAAGAFRFLLGFFSIAGRCSRAAYCWRMIVSVFLSGFLSLFLFVALDVLFDDDMPAFFVVLATVAGFASPVALSIRRLHDFDWSGHQLWAIVFVVGIYFLVPEQVAARIAGWPAIYFIYVVGCAFIKRGTEGPNQYGDDPLPTARAKRDLPPGVVDEEGFSLLLPKDWKTEALSTRGAVQWFRYRGATVASFTVLTGLKSGGSSVDKLIADSREGVLEVISKSTTTHIAQWSRFAGRGFKVEGTANGVALHAVIFGVEAGDRVCAILELLSPGIHEQEQVADLEQIRQSFNLKSAAA